MITMSMGLRGEKKINHVTVDYLADQFLVSTPDLPK